MVGLCQKSAGLCFLKQTPQPRKTAHWLKGGEGGQAKLPKHTNPLHIGMEAPQQRMRERSRTRTTPVSHYSLGFVCPSPQSSARTGPCLFLLSLLPMRVRCSWFMNFVCSLFIRVVGFGDEGLLRILKVYQSSI